MNLMGSVSGSSDDDGLYRWLKGNKAG